MTSVHGYIIRILFSQNHHSMNRISIVSIARRLDQSLLYRYAFASFSSVSSDQFYDSHVTGSEATANDDLKIPTKRSAREEFRSLPVYKSILDQIENIGVGLRPMQIKSQYMNSIRSMRRKLRDGGQLNERDEKTVLNKKYIYPDGELSSHPSTLLTPMLPFGNMIPHSGIDNHVQVKKLPVKVLGSAGSSRDELPRSTKGLPEIAIAGRSNVGKSTLLNALLYGNQVPNPRKFVRGKTPEGAKLPKGPKAIVSDLPGETKRITFYQISTQITLKNPSLQQESKQNQVKNKIDNPATDNQAKMRENISLVLIDLPGYGFAYTSDERMHEWKDLMHHFLIERGRMLKRILLLIDARHGFKKADFDFLDSLQKSLLSDSQDDQEKQGNGPNQSPKTLPPIQVVLTKCDLVKQRDLARRVVQVRRQLSDSLLRESKGNLPVMLVCAKAGLGYNNIRGSRARGGILELQSEIASLAPRSKLIRSTKRSNK